MDIKKIDDKPMVIHTKKKSKLHIHESKEGTIKGKNVYMKQKVEEAQGDNKNGRTIHPNSYDTGNNRRRFQGIRDRIESQNSSIKIKDSSLHLRGTGNMSSVRGLGELGANAMADQVEGGNEIRDATYIAHTIMTPAEGMAKASFRYSKEAMEKAGREYIRRKMKKQDITKKLAKDRIKRIVKKTAKKTASDAAKETSKEVAKETAKISAQIAAEATAEVAAEVATETAGAAAGTVAGPEGTLIGWAAGKKIGKEVGDEVGRGIEKADAKATIRLRKLRWFIDKMKAQEEQKDSIGKMIRDVMITELILKIKTARKGVCLKVYRIFPQIVYEARAQLGRGKKVHEARAQFGLLSWTHYRILTQVEDSVARNWYAKEAYEQTWASQTLQRNVSSQYYYRLLKSQDKIGVEDEMKSLTSQYQNRLEFIKNPVIAEFLGMQEDISYHESELEQCIINNLQKFLMELGKGYAFVARQQHIHTEKEDYYIDLVFYNYILKCFVLIDLKTQKITHQDVGQMDMYIRMYDELKKSNDDNPTLGIVLCADTDEDIAKYSMLRENEQLFASKYKLYLPSEEELRAEIETQKEFYYLQKKDKEEL